MDFLKTYNHQPVDLLDIPVLGYEQFMAANLDALHSQPERHCALYFGKKEENGLALYSCIADDLTGEIAISSCIVDPAKERPSFTAVNPNFEKFEREIHENFGLPYTDHPWLKPYRFAHNRHNPDQTVVNYPFFSSRSDELHEVGVGPIHAGVIEPGHFRFICNGEQVMHLEIQLGYQHRGIEQLFLQKTGLLQRATLAENIAGDTTVGHTIAFANLWESLCGVEAHYSLQFSRTLASELERIAIHTGDLAAICGDIAYQLGSAVYGRLRTPIVNFFQEWCGNRFAKGLIRPFYTNYPFSVALAERLAEILPAYERDFNEMSELFLSLPSALSRLERTGAVSEEEARKIGAVGMVARTCGIRRDIRASHPYNLFGNAIKHEPVVKTKGDVYSRALLRTEEIGQSTEYCKKLLESAGRLQKAVRIAAVPMRGKFAISMTEGWRGEIAHCAITDRQGDLSYYKIKDPSHHNWAALALAVRNNDISDFPLCNKSFNLSYCGHDL